MTEISKQNQYSSSELVFITNLLRKKEFQVVLITLCSFFGLLGVDLSLSSLLHGKNVTLHLSLLPFMNTSGACAIGSSVNT